MMLTVTLYELLICRLVCKQGLHAFHFKFHLDIGGQLFHHIGQADADIFLGIQCGADGCEQMRVVHIDDVLVIQIQGTDKCGL